MMLNFADKIVVGLAGAAIMADLKLGPTQFGLLGSSFFVLFSISAVLVGFIVNRVQTRWVILCLSLVWAAVQFPMIGTVSFTTLMICRIILGAGEGPGFSVAVHAIYKWFPDAKRTLPTTILSQGAALGVIVAAPALNWAIVTYSWHYAFGALGITGVLWAVLWLIVGKEGALEAQIATSTSAELVRVPYLRLLTSGTFIGCCLSTFGPYWALSLGLTWFTPFIVTGLHFSQKDAGWVTILPWVTGAAVVLLAGWFSQFLVARGMPTRRARGILGAAPLLIGGLILLLIQRIDDPAILIGALTLGSGLSGAIYVVCPAMIGEFTPEPQRGAMLSIYGAIYPIAGLLAPLAMGHVLQQAAIPLDGYLTGFAINGAILITSGVLGLILLRPESERARLMPAATFASTCKPTAPAQV